MRPCGDGGEKLMMLWRNDIMAQEIQYKPYKPRERKREMRIERMAAVFPSRVVTNDEIIAIIESHSKDFFTEDLKKTLRHTGRMLRASGSQERRWRNDKESSTELTAQACTKALTELNNGGLPDLLISASVYPELVEPATANAIAEAAGLFGVECFDIKEACDGWMKAAKIAASFIESGAYRRVMVVNGEFVMTPGFGIYPELFRLSTLSELEWRFPAFTLGEAAVATVFGPDPENVWEFSNTTRNDLFDLCSITTPWHKARPSTSPRLAKDGSGIFTSYGGDLRSHGFPLVVDEFRKSGIKPADVDAFFTHSSSRKDWSDVADELELSEQFYDIYSRRGNVVSAAIPAAMALAAEEGKLKRGDRVVALVGSAGMSFSLASFVF